jgi:dolichol-phosphate mannosyltransferase
VSKYGIHNRLWRGLADCFGVRWYQRRALRFDRLSDT